MERKRSELTQEKNNEKQREATKEQGMRARAPNGWTNNRRKVSRSLGKTPNEGKQPRGTFRVEPRAKKDQKGERAKKRKGEREARAGKRTGKGGMEKVWDKVSDGRGELLMLTPGEDEDEGGEGSKHATGNKKKREDEGTRKAHGTDRCAGEQQKKRRPKDKGNTNRGGKTAGYCRGSPGAKTSDEGGERAREPKEKEAKEGLAREPERRRPRRGNA